MKLVQKFKLSLFLFLLFAGSTALPTFADSPAPQRDYTIPVKNEELIFVMLSYFHGIQDSEIRAVYPQSGLYDITGKSPKALWTVDWYAFNVELTNDGQHLVRWGPWASSYTQIALEFYDGGTLTRSYKIDDLVRAPETLPHSVSHFMWRGKSDFNRANNELFVETMHGEQYLFDVSTGLLLRGELTSEAQPLQNNTLLFLKIIGIVIVFILLLIGSVRIFHTY